MSASIATFTDDGQTGREARGRQIAKSSIIKRVGRQWAVPSQTQPSSGYLVDIEESVCTCPDHSLRGASSLRGVGVRCKHQEAVLFWIAWGRDVGADGTVTETVTVKRKTYPRPEGWSAYNESQTHEKEYVERLLRALCDGLTNPPRKPGAGRNPQPIGDATFAAIMKVFSTLSGRRAQSDLRESAARGHLDHVGHFNSIYNFLAKESSTPLLVSLIEESATPLQVIENGQFAIDSTGFSTVNYERYFSFKHQKMKSTHPWVKLHIAAGTVTHAITAVKVSPEADCPQLPELLAQTMKHFKVRELSADKAYGSSSAS